MDQISLKVVDKLQSASIKSLIYSNPVQMQNFESDDAVLEACKKGDKQLVVYRGIVYDVSMFLDRHPGGKKILEPLIGKSIDKEFME